MINIGLRAKHLNLACCLHNKYSILVNKKVDGLEFFLSFEEVVVIDYFDYSIKGWWSLIILYNQALHSTQRWLILDMKRSVIQRGHVGRQIVPP